MRLPILAVSTTACALAGCSRPDVNAPSLLPRAIEQRGEAEPASAPEPVATPDPALDSRIAAIVADRTKAVDQFAADDRRLSALLPAARRAAIGSDAWLDAQTALAALETSRATVSGVLTDLEELAIARATAGQPPYPALAAAQAESDTALERINTTLAARKAALPAQ